MKEVRLDGLFEFLQAPRRIVITNHVNPDGDAMGSALALSSALSKLGHSVNVVVPNDYPDFLKWMHGTEGVVLADSDIDNATELIMKAEIIFHLDYNAYSRAGGLETLLRGSSAKSVLIDHHRQPESWPDYIYSDIEMSSTSQMIYEWLHLYGWLNHLDKNAADCLYTGMVTDTGSFRFASTSARTLKIASELMEIGVKPDDIYGKVFDNNSVSRLKLLGGMLDKMKYLPDFGAVILYLNQADQLSNNYQKGDSEGFVNYGLSISGVNMSIFLREDKGVVKTSLRSKGEIDVNALAREHFNGGGHVNAAGGMLKMTMQEALAYAEETIKKFKAK